MCCFLYVPQQFRFFIAQWPDLSGTRNLIMTAIFYLCFRLILILFLFPSKVRFTAYLNYFTNSIMSLLINFLWHLYTFTYYVLNYLIRLPTHPAFALFDLSILDLIAFILMPCSCAANITLFLYI